MVTLPRLVIAAPASGHGKTTIATGLMAALSRSGLAVSGHKVGPDYIDPGYHALATGRPGRNLDPHLVGEERLVPLLLHGARGADLAVIEGVMGLYDGQLGTDGFSSTAHVAAVTRTPVVLVVDISHASRSIAATVHGMTTWAPDAHRDGRGPTSSGPVDVVGLVLNKAGSVRHSDEVVRALGSSRIPVLGILQRDDGVAAPSRHLGLVPAAERDDAAAALDLLAAQVAERIDLEAVVRLAKAAPDLHGHAWEPGSHRWVEEGTQAPVPNPGVGLRAGSPGFETGRDGLPQPTGEGLRAGSPGFETGRDGLPQPTGVGLRAGSPGFETGRDGLPQPTGAGLRAGSPGFETGRDGLPQPTGEGLRAGSSGFETGRDGLPQPTGEGGERPVIAIAGGRAFTFAYAETTELLRAAGCEPVVFDPTRDESLPDGTQGLYLGGGFPEVHAGELSSNEPLRHQLRAAIAAGLPTVAECAGLLYLCDHVDGSPMVGAVRYDAAMAPRLTLAYRHATSPTANLLGRPGETVTGHEFHRTRLLAPPAAPAWAFSTGLTDGIATESLHASYLHTHWAGHPQLAERFVAAVRAATPVRLVEEGALRPSRNQGGSAAGFRDGPGRPSSTNRALAEPLRHHGDREATAGLLDFAVNVYDGPHPDWLARALAAADLSRYPDAAEARAAISEAHGRSSDEVLATAGAAEAFGLLARVRPWRHPVVVHPQFTEPDVALTTAGHQVRHLVLDAGSGFTLDPDGVPVAADLVVIGNPTNPTGVRHPAAAIRSLVRPGRLVVVDEAFLDDGTESLAGQTIPGLLVIRSLTKLWSIPGVRAGYLLGDAEVVEELARLQTPWSVSANALAALVACSATAAKQEADVRVQAIAQHRAELESGLTRLGIEYVAGSTAPYVLARPGTGVHEALRTAGVAVRRADTFPGLGPDWVRIAVRRPEQTDLLLEALGEVMTSTRPAD